MKQDLLKQSLCLFFTKLPMIMIMNYWGHFTPLQSITQTIIIKFYPFSKYLLSTMLDSSYVQLPILSSSVRALTNSPPPTPVQLAHTVCSQLFC